MILTAPVLAYALVVAQAGAPLPDPIEVGKLSGRSLGTAAACGIPIERVSAARRAWLVSLRQVGYASEGLRKAEVSLDLAIFEAMATTQDGWCPRAIDEFERAERRLAPDKSIMKFP